MVRPALIVGTGVEVWSSAAWRKGAVSWLDEQLAREGVRRTGEVEQRYLRPWATVLSAPTTRGPVWLKAAGPGTAFEAGLYPILHRVVPDRVLHPLAADPARGWVLLPDGGPRLGDRLDDLDLVGALERVLPQYGELQRSLVPHVDEMLAAGVPDMRPGAMGGRFDEAVDAVAGYVRRHGTPTDEAILQCVVETREAYDTWRKRLAAAPAAPSLDHNDLHRWNILVSGDRATLRARFYDWGDSVIAHPFATMSIALSSLARQLGVDASDRRILRVRDAYLEGWSGGAPRAELIETLELACRVGKIARTLSWARAVMTLGDRRDPDFERAPLESLGSLLDDAYLART